MPTKRRMLEEPEPEPSTSRPAQEQLTLFPSYMAREATVAKSEKATFSVDTHLFRELGELLVGRDSTALVELIKNAYDADAEEVVVYGEAIGDAEHGYIKIVDRNGNGMTPEEFKAGFLRIASRLKESGQRRSRRYRRRYTGAKGIGRLAAHKLARVMEVLTIPKAGRRHEERSALKAVIDWDKVEKHETLADLENTDAVKLETLRIPPGVEAGTEITLRRLRGKWSQAERKRFIDEVQTFEPPSVLTETVEGIIPESALFDRVSLRGESKSGDPGFRVRLEGDFEPGEDYWDVIAQAAHWLIEIDARPDSESVEYSIKPTQSFLRERPEAESTRFATPQKFPREGPFFQARIFVRDPTRRGKVKVREWARRSTGIKVFVEGFRVPPYGEKGNDWLEIDADYTQRSRPIKRLVDLGFEAHSEAGLTNLPNSSYFGAVFLTQDGAAGLRPLVNREGFVPDTSYYYLSEMVRIGIDLATRHRAALHHRVSEPHRQTARSASEPGPPAGEVLSESLTAAVELAKAARASAVQGDMAKAVRLVEELEQPLRDARESHEELAQSSAMFQVVASVGTQMATFVHEIRSLLEMAEGIEKQVEKLRSETSLSRGARTALGRLFRNMGQLRQALERQAAYLVDIVTPDARRRRSRQRLRDVFEAAWHLVARQAERRGIRAVNAIPADLKSPPMFRAEIVAVLANLLTNAVKAAGGSGKVRASGEENQGIVLLRIENTGIVVDVRESEKWFRPFESTTADPDPSLGQGMGLGLTLTRSLLEEYGATIQFVPPTTGFATSLEITFHTRRR